MTLTILQVIIPRDTVISQVIIPHDPVISQVIIPHDTVISQISIPHHSHFKGNQEEREDHVDTDRKSWY